MGLVAGLVVLDLRQIRARATFFEPHQYAVGVDYVLVNGRFVVDGAKLNGELPGKVITPRESRGGEIPD